MRESASQMTEEEFVTTVAELSDAGYFEELGVFHPLGRSTPIITRGDRTQLSELAKRSIGRWGSDTTTMPNTDAADSGDQRVFQCAVCQGNENVQSIFPSRPWLALVDEEGSTEVRQLPPVHLCDVHRMPTVTGEIVIGWCDDPTCRHWGVEGRQSPCGQAYREIPEAGA